MRSQKPNVIKELPEGWEGWYYTGRKMSFHIIVPAMIRRITLAKDTEIVVHNDSRQINFMVKR